MTGPQGDVQLFELRIVATGEVRDAAGNLLNGDVTAESAYIVDEQEARAIIERHARP